MNKAFGVELQKGEAGSQTFRVREGGIYVPELPFGRPVAAFELRSSAAMTYQNEATDREVKRRRIGCKIPLLIVALSYFCCDRSQRSEQDFY